MATRITRRLPGFRFEVQSPPLRETLPRMDVAVFVGFAASGPLHTPVPVEDIAQFTAIFGADAIGVGHAARENSDGYLAPAVRAFFRNGGRRCWIVRVAGSGLDQLFPIPGLALAEFDELGQHRITPAFAQARSEGSWSDSCALAHVAHAVPSQCSDCCRRGLGLTSCCLHPEISPPAICCA